MKHRNKDLLPLILTFFIFLLLLIAGWYFVTLPIPQQSKADTSKIKVNPELLKETVTTLSSVNPARSYKNAESLNKVSDYISAKFAQLCPQIDVQKYEVEGAEYRNLICRFPGTSAEKIVVGAHYDVASGDDVAGEKPGADDNASGVAGLLELVRLTNDQNLQLPYTLEFVAYTLEEPPFFRTNLMGSAVHAKNLKENGDKVKLMISLEMIGYFDDTANSQSYPLPFLSLIYPNQGNFIGIIGKIDQFSSVKKLKSKMMEGSNIPIESFTAPNIVPGMDFSDHLNYWNNGFNAVIITDTAFERNHNYHKETDTIEKLNFEKMAEAVKGVYWAITHL